MSSLPVLSFINTKGGVGKTHLSALLSGIYAGMGLRVLMIDADADQASLTQFYPLKHRADAGLVEMVASAIQPEMVSSTTFEGPGVLDIVCANDSNGQLRTWMTKRMDQYFRIRDAIHSPFVTENYDLIVIDTKGNGGPLEDAAAVAASQIISPIVPDIVSTREFLSGTLDLLDKLQQVRSLGITPPPIRAVIYRMERTKNAGEVANILRSEIASRQDPNLTICQTVIPNAVAFTQAASEGVPLQKLIRAKLGAPTREIELLQRIAWEILPAHSLCFADGVEFDVSGEA